MAFMFMHVTIHEMQGNLSTKAHFCTVEVVTLQQIYGAESGNSEVLSHN